MADKKKQWVEIYKTSSSNGYYENGRWFVSQYFGEGYLDNSSLNWQEGDFAVDSDDEDYGIAVNKGYDAFLDAIGEGTIIDYNRNKKELPEHATPEKES